MGVDLNPGITPGLGGANAAQPLEPTKQALDPTQPDAAGEPGAENAVPGVWSQLQQWIATAGLQGTVAVDAPEIAAQQQGAQAGGNVATESQSARAAQQAVGNQSLAAPSHDERAAVIEPARDPSPANRSQVGAAELTLPTTAAAAQLSALAAQDAIPAQALQQGVFSSLVSGQPQPMWQPGAGRDEPKVQQRSPRDQGSRARHDDDSLFDDDMPEQRVREREAHEHDAARDDHARGGDDDWCAALSRRLARLHRDAGASRHASARAGDAHAGAQAFDLALAQWAQGRAVLVACPQRSPMDDSGWACLVWGDAAPADARDSTAASRNFAASINTLAHDPRAPGVHAHVHGAAHPLRLPKLHGQRFAARLHWKHEADDESASHARWWAVRTAKQHGVALGRQLRTMSDGGERADESGASGASSASAASAALRTRGLAVQLGPVLLPQAREWTLRVRIDAVQRVWSALEGQWSLLVIGCDEPLLPG
jgi:hypothetical protein